MIKSFELGPIEGVIVRDLKKYVDDRGWLCELFRQDEIPEWIWPVMSYVSLTMPGVARGPHEHVAQWGYFCFFGPANFKIYLWDNRQGSPSCGKRMVVFAGADAPKAIAVPPGVVHAYRNAALEPGLVFNAANRFFAGQGRQEPVDEIRWEQADGSPFGLD
jgi:dTDP-4-dehydrorhamnose 3,5-epimerase